MQVGSKKKRIYLCLLMCMLSIFLITPLSVSASSWTSDSDGSIYTDTDEKEKDEKNKDKDKEVGTLEKMVSTLVVSLADGVNGLLSFADCSLDRIVLGRVNSGSKKTSMFTFELIKGNPYGTVAAISYATLRGIVLTGLLFVLLQKIIKASMSNGNAQARAEFKSSMSQYGISVLMLFVMPYLFDLAIYIRNATLYILTKQYSELSGGDSLSLIETFREVAVKSDSLTDALMYLGAVAITLWFIFEYVGLALATLLLFTLFVFVALFSNYKKDALMTWVENAFSMLATPVIDVILLWLPIIFSTFFKDAGLIRMALCAMIIPARRMAKNFLGLSSAGSGVLSAMSAMFAARGIAKAGRGAIGGLAKVGNMIKNGRADMKHAKMEDELGAAERMDEQEALQMAGFSGNRSNGKKEFGKMSGEGSSFGKTESAENMVSRVSASDRRVDNSADSVIGQTKGADKAGAVFGMGYNAGEKTLGRKTDVDDMDMTAPVPETVSDGMGQLKRRKESLESSNNNHRKEIAGYGKQKTNLATENARLKEEEIKNNAYGANDEQIAKNKTKMAELDEAIAKENASIADNNDQIGQINSRMDALKSSGMMGMSGGLGNNVAGTSHRQEVLRKHANIVNFESPEFKGLSHEDKAALYRKRAMRQFATAGATAVGGTAMAAAGGVVGGGAGLFYGPSMAIMTAAAGASAGGMIGAGAAGAGISAGAAVVSGVQKGVRYINASQTSPQMPSESAPTRNVQGRTIMTEGSPTATSTRATSMHGSGGVPVRVQQSGVQGRAATIVREKVQSMSASGVTIVDLVEEQMFQMASEGKSYADMQETIVQGVCTKMFPDGGIENVNEVRDIMKKSVQANMDVNKDFYENMYDDAVRVRNERL